MIVVYKVDRLTRSLADFAKLVEPFDIIEGAQPPLRPLHLVVRESQDKTARVWIAPPMAPDFIATACKMLGKNQDTAGLLTRYGVDVKDPICTGDAPAPDPSRMIER